MQQLTKIQLSQAEQSLMQNADWILTKNGIMEKMKLLLQECLEAQQEIFFRYKKDLPETVFLTSPKISRGENYRGLPWLMLDYPRYFEKENLPDRLAGFFAIRTFFWWGNFFSITLHLSGIYKKMYEQKISAACTTLSAGNYFVGISNNEWEHHFETENYKLVSTVSEAAFDLIIKEKEFIKLAAKVEFEKWNELPQLSASVCKTLMKILI